VVETRRFRSRPQDRFLAQANRIVSEVRRRSCRTNRRGVPGTANIAARELLHRSIDEVSDETQGLGGTHPCEGPGRKASSCDTWRETNSAAEEHQKTTAVAPHHKTDAQA